jgi:hypothetical protein
MRDDERRQLRDLAIAAEEHVALACGEGPWADERGVGRGIHSTPSSRARSSVANSAAVPQNTRSLSAPK